MDTFNAWWDSLQVIIKIFYAIGMLATAVLGVQTLLTVFGLDGHDAADMDIDLDVDSDHGGDLPTDDGGASFISIRGITAFLVGFGWVGALCLKSGLTLIAVLPIAICVGLVLMVVIYFIMRFFWSMRESGTLDYHNAIGKVGSVYLPIPPNREGNGQVEVLIQERLQVLQAQTSASERIENRAKVLVIDVMEDNTLIVRPEN